MRVVEKKVVFFFHQCHSVKRLLQEVEDNQLVKLGNFSQNANIVSVLNPNAGQVTEVTRQTQPHVSTSSRTPELFWEQTDRFVPYLLNHLSSVCWVEKTKCKLHE